MQWLTGEITRRSLNRWLNAPPWTTQTSSDNLNDKLHLSYLVSPKKKKSFCFCFCFCMPPHPISRKREAENYRCIMTQLLSSAQGHKLVISALFCCSPVTPDLSFRVHWEHCESSQQCHTLAQQWITCLRQGSSFGNRMSLEAHEFHLAEKRWQPNKWCRWLPVISILYGNELLLNNRIKFMVSRMWLLTQDDICN